MGKINEYRKSGIGFGKRNTLHAPGHAAKMGESVPHRTWVSPQSQRGGGGLHAVHNGKAPGDGRVEAKTNVGRGKLKGNALLPHMLDLLGVESGTGSLPAGTHAIRHRTSTVAVVSVADVVVVDGQRLSQQTPSVAVVGIDHHLAAHLEKSTLGGVVILHRAVEIQVLGGQIGKDPQLKAEGGYLSQQQSVGGDLHHHGRRIAAIPWSILRHASQQRIQLPRIRGGHTAVGLTVGGTDHSVASHGTTSHRADQTAGNAGCSQQSVEHGGDRGLPVGACNGNHTKLSRWMPIPSIIEVCHSHAGIGNRNHRDIHRHPRRKRRFANHSHRPVSFGFRYTDACIGVKTVDGDEQIPFLHAAGIRSDAVHRDLPDTCR